MIHDIFHRTSTGFDEARHGVERSAAEGARPSHATNMKNIVDMEINYVSEPSAFSSSAY